MSCGPPEQNGKRQLHDVYTSRSSDDEDVQRDGHQQKKRQSTIVEKERSIPQPGNDRVPKKRIRSTDIKLVFFSGHCLLLADCHLQDDQGVGKGTWKLNGKLLTPKNIEQFKRYYTDVGVHVMEDLQEVKNQQVSLFAWEASKIIFQSRVHTMEQDEMKDMSMRGATIPGSRGLQVKASLYRDDVTVFYLDPLSVNRLMSICDQFKQASGAKVNRGNNKAMFSGNRANQSFIPFIIRADYLKMLGIWDSMYKTLDKREKNVPNVALVLMATFVCGCIKLCIDPWYAYYILRFYLSLMLQRMGLASLPWNAPSSWTIPYHLSFVEKFAKKHTFDHQSIRKWSTHSVLETLREKERVVHKQKLLEKLSRSGSICEENIRVNVSGLVTLPHKGHRTRNINSDILFTYAARPAELFQQLLFLFLIHSIC
eukprot:g45211.t1